MQIFVVVNQPNLLTGNKGTPAAAYSDYMSALTFAESIFTPTLMTDFTARDLVFPVVLTETTTTTTTT